MFLDHRFGTRGQIPTAKKLPEIYFISNERRLYLRLTSPHEMKETTAEFFRKSVAKMKSGRWCLASALQPDAAHKMPDVVEAISKFVERFEPERVRVIFFAPDCHGFHDEASCRRLSRKLLKMGRVEVAFVDARKRRSNGLFLADFSIFPEFLSFPRY